MAPSGLINRPQQERSRTTQLRLMEATVSCLITHGWSGTTTTLVAETAGVSRGAQLHHYPTKTGLVLAAVEHLTERRAREIRAEAAALPADAGHRVERVVDMLAASFTGPLFHAALEVWVAARTDHALREALGPLEAKIGRELFRLTAQLLAADETRADVRNAIQATLELLRGLGVANLLTDDSTRRRAVLHGWTEHLTGVLYAARRAPSPMPDTRRAPPRRPGRAHRRGASAHPPTSAVGDRMPDIASVLVDLDAESRDLDALVADRPAADWARDTPAAGWTVAHQISHLAWTDHAALLSTTDPQAFLAALTPAFTDPDHFVDRAAADGISPAPELLARWRAGRAALTEALAVAPRDIKLPWYGVGMSPISMATGRIMETWAHGQDVADALGVTRVPTARLRHVVHLATRTVGFSFAAHGRPAPDAPIRLELAAPDGSVWEYGPADAADRVTGRALDFCLVATHRRHRGDVALDAVGDIADAWLDVVQTFAGPPGAPREALA